MSFPSNPLDSESISDYSELYQKGTNLFNSDIEPFTEITINNLSIFEGKDKLFDELKPEDNKSDMYSGPPIFKRIGKFYSERRKENKDLIRKKTKSKFYKEMKTQMNKRFKRLKIKDKFDWSQSLITNVEKSKNKKDLNTTLENLLLDNNILIYEKNRLTIKNTGLNNIFETNMKDLYTEYIKSKQFQDVIGKLIDEQNSYEYIHNYIQMSENFVDFYEKAKDKYE